MTLSNSVQGRRIRIPCVIFKHFIYSQGFGDEVRHPWEQIWILEMLIRNIYLIQALCRNSYCGCSWAPFPGFVHLWLKPYLKMLISGSWPSGAGSVHFWLKPYYENIHFESLAARARIRSFLVKALFRKHSFWTPARPSPDLFIFGLNLIWKMLFSASWPSEPGFAPFWFKPYLEIFILGPWPPQRGSVHFG